MAEQSSWKLRREAFKGEAATPESFSVKKPDIFVVYDDD